MAPRHCALAAYERELIGLVHAVRHWRPYLWGRRFIVMTDHYSLKYLLDQRLSTIPQHHWVGKLLGFDFAVEYKPGHTNGVADALSCRDTPEDGAVLVLSAPRFDFIERLRQQQESDPATTPAREHCHGQWWMGWCSTTGGCTSHPRSPSFRTSWWPSTRRGTKACNVPCTDCGATSIFLT